RLLRPRRPGRLARELHPGSQGLDRGGAIREGAGGVSALTSGVEVTAPVDEEVLTPEALDFVARLHRELNPVRSELLERRRERQRELDEGALPGFLPETEPVRAGDWRVAAAPADLRDRRCEITGP